MLFYPCDCCCFALRLAGYFDHKRLSLYDDYRRKGGKIYSGRVSKKSHLSILNRDMHHGLSLKIKTF
ncbi:hypothetical protein ACI8B_290081 [Acinetobacter proteolyticus]|uniref:Uncharacterized protein n=1 Tax=Acinetobacter proteolyticus TaxID=1776741 RepID=A0A653K6A0_9GAMM|nr:hypothetical protein ACI8B_290081 [Acinetobacter proteolyticus]